MSDFKNTYLDEAEDLFNKIEQILLLLDVQPDDPSLIAEIFRYLHTMKGNSAMLGSQKVTDIVHDIETIFDNVRTHQSILNQEVIDCTLKTIDPLKKIVLNPKSVTNVDEKDLLKLTRQLAAISTESNNDSNITKDTVQTNTYHIYCTKHP